VINCACRAAPADPDTSLSEIIVTATRVPERADKSLEPVLVIDRQALEDSLAVDIGDVLRFHAGIDIDRTGGPGQPLSLFIRGANSDQSIVMIDGVRINSGTQALAPLMNISPELFDRIEIVKGPRSAIYGTDAIGGVVNLITRTDAPSGADVMLDYGRYGTGEFAVDGNYTAGATSVQAHSPASRAPASRPTPPTRSTAAIKTYRAPRPSRLTSTRWSLARATTRRQARRSTPTPSITPTSPRSNRSRL
jgi:outer membrane cobalamin receptor